MPERTCAVGSCGRAAERRGWCVMHYKRWRRHGDPLWEPPRRGCSVPGCSGRHEARGLCNVHYERWRVQVAAAAGRPAEDPSADMEAWVRWLTAPV